MNALIIDSDGRSAARAARSLTDLGYRCCVAPSGEKGLQLAASATHDVILLEIKLPGISGLEVIRRLRDAGNHAPLIVVSALVDPGARIAGLNLGADDYLAKPFVPGELIARINAILRRCTARACERIVVRELTVDVPTRTVTYGNREVILTAREFEVLEYLARNAGRVLSISTIYRKIWKEDVPPPTKVVETRICLIRKKLCPAGDDVLIHTVKGFGYVLK